MSKTNKKHRKSKRKLRKNRYTFKQSRVPPKRIHIMRGGNSHIFPASFSNDSIAASPQSYLPYNNFSSDPNYYVIGARNTGTFFKGGSSSNKNKSRKRKIHGGGGDGSAYISNTMNWVTNQSGIIPVPALNESSGVAGIMSGFSNTGSVYNPTPVKLVPLA